MPKSIPVLFKRSLLATAVLSLSACSSMPQVSDISLGSVGAGIAKAGKATAEAGRKTWNTTTYLLGFSDSIEGSDPARTDDQLLIAEEDLNQIEPLAGSDMPAIEGDNSNRPILIQQATANATGDAPQLANADTSLANPALPTKRQDLTHEVAKSETLWDIAKTTTGNANNWHVLADVNNLGQNATVFPGQKLVIPGDMVKPDFDMPVAALEPADTNDAASTLTLGDSSNLGDPAAATEGARLAIPSTSDAGDQSTDAEIELARIRENAEAFDIGEGESLWEFSRRTTGNATNWQAIAAHNNFTEKQAVTVRPGQTVYVPKALVRKVAATASTAPAITQPVDNTASIVAVAETVATDNTVEETLAAAIPATAVDQQLQQRQQLQRRVQERLRLQQGQSLQNAQLEQPLTDQQTTQMVANASVADETQGISIVETNYKTDDSLDPSNTTNESVQMVENADIPAQIMVSGTYYPKAVYNYADFSSSLLMRVSPGTKLQVSRAMGTWFEVKTDKGLGYVHERDIQ